jgi:hypothetical protein
MDALQPPSEERKTGRNLDKNISGSKRDGKDADDWFFDIIGTFNTTSSWKLGYSLAISLLFCSVESSEGQQSLILSLIFRTQLTAPLIEPSLIRSSIR